MSVHLELARPGNASMCSCAIITKVHRTSCSGKKQPHSHSNSHFFTQIEMKRRLFVIMMTLPIFVTNANCLTEAIRPSILLAKRSIATIGPEGKNISVLPEMVMPAPLPSANVADNTRTTLSVSELTRSTSEITSTKVDMNLSRNRHRITSHSINGSYGSESTQASVTFGISNDLLANVSDPFYEKNESGSSELRDKTSQERPKYSPSGKIIPYNSTVAGSCGLPVYNNSTACLLQNFFTDPISKCEYEFGRIIFTAIVGATATAAIFVNLLILVVIVANSKMRTAYCYIKASLAVADSLIGFLVFTTVIPKSGWVRTITEVELATFIRDDVNSPSAIIVGSMLTVSMQASLLHLCFLSIERFSAITWPLAHKRRRPVTVKIMLAVIWAFSLLAAFMPAFFPRHFEYKFQPALLIHLLMLNERGRTLDLEAASAGIVLAVLELIIPYLLTVLFCVLTAVVSRQRLRHGAPSGNGARFNSVDKRLQSEISVFVTILFMIGAFTLTLLPFTIAMLLFLTGVLTCSNHTVVYATCFFFGKLNSLSNGLVYSVREPKFREAVKQLLRIKS